MADRHKITGDDSYTVFHQSYDEAMHSYEGAYAEALHRHVLPSRALTTGEKNLRILDVGFGIGYNILACIAQASRNGIDKKIEFISFEYDRSYRKLMSSLSFGDYRDSLYALVRTAYDTEMYSGDSFTIRVLFGDARDTIRTIQDESCNAVFHDPFSPAKNPELWSVDFFRELYRVVRDDAIITTYSRASQVRSAFFEAGFFIGENRSPELKKNGTVAAKNREYIEALFSESIQDLMKDIRSVPYRDPMLNRSRDALLDERIETMSRLRKEKGS